MKQNGYQLVHESINQSHSFVKQLETIIPDVKKISLTPEIKDFKDYGKVFIIKYYLPKSNSCIAVASKNSSFNTLLGFVILKNAEIPVCFIEVNPSIDKKTIITTFNTINSAEKIKTTFNKIKSTTGINKFLKNISQKGKSVTEGSDKVDTIMINIAKYSNYILLIVSIAALIFFFIKKIKYKIEEHNVETEVERDINESLFKSQKENDSAFEDYDHLKSFIKQTIKGPYPAIIICGPPGTSKTHMIRRTFYFSKIKPGSDYVIERGATLGLIDIFALLYRQRNSILVLDDFDTPLKNVDTINFLKSITDSYKRRVLSMPRVGVSSQDNKQSEYDIPQKFEYTGKLIMVTNLKKKELDIALVSRCPTIEISFSTEQMITIIFKLMKYVHPEVSMEIKEEVFNYIVGLYKKNKNVSINFRSFQNSISSRVVNPNDWKDMVNYIVGYST